MTEIEISIAKARFDYLTILKAGIKKWRIDNEDERKRLESLVIEIDKYRDLLANKINEKNN